MKQPSRFPKLRRQSFVRPLVRRLIPYVPGEQPAIKGLIKLNTNENPYPPSPKVLAAMKDAVDGRLRLYPNPTAKLLREKLASFHRCRPENLIIGNGSDELLAMAVRCFVEPQPGNTRRPDCLVQFFTPSYSLYPVLASTHGAAVNPVPLNKDFSLPQLKPGTPWNFQAALSLITTPNAPSGRAYTTDELGTICKRQQGVVLLDEAYVDFANENALALALKFPHVLVARTFSKAYSLCYQRIGYFVGHPDLIQALDKIRDSYNVNGLGQIGALATLDDLSYYRARFRQIIATRAWLSSELATLGFQVSPSQTNFILVTPPRFSAKRWLELLREQKVLVRWFHSPGINNFLRITIGTQIEALTLVKAVRRILK